MIFYSEFSEQITTYENILNSGNLNLIKDYDLKQKIVEYHRDIENFQLLETYFHDYFSETFMPFLMINYDLFSQKLTISNTHNSILFKNIFGTHFSLTQQRHEGYKGLLDESMKIIVELNRQNSKEVILILQVIKENLMLWNIEVEVQESAESEEFLKRKSIEFRS